MAENINKEIGKEIASVLEGLRIKPAGFAREIDMDESYFYRHLAGKHRWTAEWLQKICDKLRKRGFVLSLDKFYAGESLVQYDITGQAYKVVTEDLFDRNRELCADLQQLTVLIRQGCKTPNGPKGNHKHCCKVRNLLKITSVK